MEYMEGSKGFYVQEDSAVSLGKFNGVHRGHQKLLHKVLDYKSQGYGAAVFALQNQKAPALLTNIEKRALLEKMGMDYLIDCPFVPEISNMEPEEFVKKILVGKLHAKYIVVGEDFRFGHNRAGDVTMLRELENVYGFHVDIMEKECDCQGKISSTRVRQELERGNMEQVNELLGYNYYVFGEVLHGRALGRTLGMPTTNLVPSTKKLLPPNGVYFSVTEIRGKKYPGVTNIGYKPTVGEKFRGVETYLFDFDGDLYGMDIKVQLLHYRRQEKKFLSVDELKEEMHRDIEAGKEYFYERSDDHHISDFGNTIYDSGKTL